MVPSSSNICDAYDWGNFILDAAVRSLFENLDEGPVLPSSTKKEKADYKALNSFSEMNC